MHIIKYAKPRLSLFADAQRFGYNLEGGVMPIALAPVNQEMEIKKVGAEDKTKKHLQEMGIAVGSKITVLSSGSGGVIVVVKEGRLCLDRTLASKILVA